eukprot:981789-Rhodomonas_salina.1
MHLVAAYKRSVPHRVVASYAQRYRIPHSSIHTLVPPYARSVPHRVGASYAYWSRRTRGQYRTPRIYWYWWYRHIGSSIREVSTAQSGSSIRILVPPYAMSVPHTLEAPYATSVWYNSPVRVPDIAHAPTRMILRRVQYSLGKASTDALEPRLPLLLVLLRRRTIPAQYKPRP